MLVLCLRAVAVVMLMLTRCGGGSPTIALPLAPTGPDPAAGTYLETAVPQGQRFRWTPSAGSAQVDIPVEIFDGPSELPALMIADGFTADEIERQVRRAFDTWAVPLRAFGLPAPVLDLRRHSRGEDFRGDRRTRILIHLRQDRGLSFHGATSMLRIGTRLDRVRQVDIDLYTPLLGARPSLDGYQALLLHEAGHALGILADPPSSGHSAAEQDVMFPVANWIALSTEDQRAIRALYSEVPDIVREDQMPNTPAGVGGNSHAFVVDGERLGGAIPGPDSVRKVSCEM